MSTLKDLYDIMAFEKGLANFMGTTAEFAQEYAMRMQAIATAVMAERGITDAEQAAKIDTNNELLNQSAPLFEDLKSWLRTQHPSFAAKITETETSPGDKLCR